jgi:hypothetical protein
MDTIRAGLQESANGLSVKGLRKSSDTTVSVSSSTISNGSSEKTVLLADDAVSIVRSSSTRSHVTTTSSIQITRVVDISRSIRGDICKLGDYNESFFKTLDLRSYLEYISDERYVSSLPCCFRV